MTKFARNFLHSIGMKSPWEDVRVGDIVPHPDLGRVQITGGQYWGTHGVSNFWYYRTISPEGVLGRKEFHGYGW